MSGSGILWVIGAGASKHLDMPLLTGFRDFFSEIWYRFPENRKDPELQETLLPAIGIMDFYKGKNIEEILAHKAVKRENIRILKDAIRRSFQKRQQGRLFQGH